MYTTAGGWTKLEQIEKNTIIRSLAKAKNSKFVVCLLQWKIIINRELKVDTCYQMIWQISIQKNKEQH